MTNTNRLDFIDIAKGLGIIFVILGHSASIPLVLGRCVYSFHMPLFFILSGYCFTYRPEQGYGRFLAKNAKALLLPYLVTGGLIILSRLAASAVPGLLEKLDAAHTGEAYLSVKGWILGLLYGSGSTNTINPSWDGIVYSVGIIWFLLAMFFGRAFLWLILKSRVPWIWALILFCVSFVSKEWFWLPLSIQPAMCSTFFLLLGYELRRREVFISRKVPAAAWILSGAAWGYCFVFGLPVNMIDNFYGDSVVSIFGIFTGCYFITGLSVLIEKYIPALRRVLSFAGRKSLALMCSSMLCYMCWPKQFVWHKISELTGIPGWVVDFLDMLVITCLIALVLYYIPFINRVYFPERRKNGA